MALATNIHVVFDSRYGHIDTMAEAVAAGSDQAGNIEVTPVRVAELVPHEVLEESGAKAARGPSHGQWPSPSRWRPLRPSSRGSHGHHGQPQ